MNDVINHADVFRDGHDPRTCRHDLLCLGKPCSHRAGQQYGGRQADAVAHLGVARADDVTGVSEGGANGKACGSHAPAFTR